MPGLRRGRDPSGIGSWGGPARLCQQHWEMLVELRKSALRRRWDDTLGRLRRRQLW